VKNKHVISGHLKQLASLAPSTSGLKAFIKWSATEEQTLATLSKEILNFASKHAKSQPHGVCDGFALCSVTFSLCAGLLLKKKPFLGALQHIFYYGGDTDTVGAMAGSLLGAYKGLNDLISTIHCNQLVRPYEIQRIFRVFLKAIINPESMDAKLQRCADFIGFEAFVTGCLIKLPLQEKRSYFKPIDKKEKKWFYDKEWENVGLAIDNSLSKSDLLSCNGQEFLDLYEQVLGTEAIYDKVKVLTSEQRKELFTFCWQKKHWSQADNYLKSQKV